MPTLNVLQSQGLLPQPGISANPTGAAAQFSGAVDSVVGQAAALYKQHQDDQARVWAGNALSDFHLTQLQGIQSQRDAVAQGVAQGQPVPDMTGDFLKQFDDQAGKLVSNAPTEQAKTYMSEQLASTRESLGAHMISQQADLTRQWKATSFQTSTDNAGKIVQQDPTQFDAQMQNLVTTQPHFDPATDQQRLLAVKETLTNAAASSTIDRDPYAMKYVTGKAMGEGGEGNNGEFQKTGVPWIDMATPAQVKTWNSLAEEKIRRLENAARLDVDARERQAQTTFNTLQGFVAQGSIPDLSYISQVKSDTSGTSFEASANQAIDLATRGAGFGSATLPAQQARLEQMQTQQGGGTNPQDAELLKQLQTIHTTQTSAYKDDPLEAANRFAHTPGMPTQQISTIEQGLQLVTQRTGGLPAVEMAAGAPASPLHPAESMQLGRLIRSMQPDQAASALSTIGHAVGDPQRIAALAKQFSDKDGTLGLAMAYAGDKTNMGRMVSELLLRGDQALKDKRTEVEVQKQENWRATAATQIRGAFSDLDVENQAIEAATRINAATALNGQDDMDAAVRMATGGITTHGAADAKIPLPYGMKASDFEKKISALTPASFSSQIPDGVVHVGAATIQLPQFVSSLKDATLVHAGQGVYNVRGGNTLATNAQGQRIWIKVTP